METQVQKDTARMRTDTPNWVANASVLWEHRRSLLRIAVLGALISVPIAFSIPKEYESTARIMPPESSSAGTAVLAALAGRGGGSSELGGLGGLAASLLGVRTTGPLFVDLLRSASVADELIQRFQLQQVYHKRYRVDTAKKLGHKTSILEDKKSGVISITVEDSDPQRARDMVQAYLDQLNLLVNRTNTSSARQERIFIEDRLAGAQRDLERAQKELSNFSSTHSTIDLKEQTRATVDAAAKLQAQLIVEQSDLDSLKQIYGDQNVRVRAARARIAELNSQLKSISGTSAPLDETGGSTALDSGADRLGAEYPPLRQLPRLAVPYADLYRAVRVQEAVYELLTQQYEVARIQEAKDLPVVRVIDAPGVPEKKSFPPRAIFAILFAGLVVIAGAVFILVRERWVLIDQQDPRKRLIERIVGDLRQLKRVPEYK
ncbi:MAG TPA: Wzz/FepE/Etk N-terminal domain-containing protein [Terracidiphilus sp.]|jgi:capsule polysaccharide export protein KpsE/RkpR